MNPILPRLTRDKHNNDINRKKRLPPPYRGTSFLCSALLAATSINLLISDNLVLALTRGAMYDDLLVSGIGNNSKSNGTDQTAVTEKETAIGGKPKCYK